jgi:outer membrane protein assembly factor BamB
LADTRQIVIVNESSVSGHRVDDGMELWSHPWPGGSTSSASVSQAMAVGPTQVLLSKGYGIGSSLIEVTRGSDDAWTTRALWEQAGLLKTKFTNVAVRGGYAYGLSDGILECVDISAGQRRWKVRRGGDFGHGQILLVDDLLLVSAEDGTVALVEANPDQFVKLGEFAALGDQTWNTMCLASPYLLVRNAVEAACYELPLRTGAQ